MLLKRKYRTSTDASKSAIFSEVSLKVDDFSHELPVEYASSRLTKAEEMLARIEKEALAITSAC